MDLLVQGLLLGGLYTTTALGLSLVFGVIKMVNLAHGEFLVVGAYLTSILVALFGLDPLLLSIPAALALAAIAYPLQRYVLSPVMQRSGEAPMIVTFGVAIVAQTLLLLSFGSSPRTVNAPYATMQFEVFGVPVRTSLLIATVIGVLLVFVLHYMLYKTPFGRRVRAASTDPEAAGFVGIDTKHTYALVLSIAAGISAIGGTLIALSFAVSPESGTGWLLRAFTVVIIGGLGSIRGALVGALILGLVETFGSAWFGPQYRDVIVFGGLVLMLLIRPSGLFGKAVRA